MDKRTALELLGGPVAAARTIGVTRQAIHRWPDPLTAKIEDRVLAALYRLGKTHAATA
jgi:hypothetical protein